MENFNKTNVVDNTEIIQISDYSSSPRKSADTGGLTVKQQLKRDALELAELIYDMFKENENDTTDLNVSRKGDQIV